MRRDFVRKRVSAAENEMFVQPFTEDEAREAIWGCNSSKSPGPDGFNFRFIKEFLDILKEDFLGMLEEFHQNGKLVRGINPMFIVLIPKREDASSLNDYRPISLIGCVY